MEKIVMRIQGCETSCMVAVQPKAGNLSQLPLPFAALPPAQIGSARTIAA
jgi:hypothetical protein